MSLTDGAIAELARQAADEIGPDVQVHVRPPANDDPYRWGGHGWLVRIGATTEVWIPVEASPDEALSRLREAVRTNSPKDGE